SPASWRRSRHADRLQEWRPRTVQDTDTIIYIISLRRHRTMRSQTGKATMPRTPNARSRRIDMRLTPDVCLVGGGGFGFGRTSPGDGHVYLLGCGAALILSDAGIGGVAGDPALILQEIRRDGYDPARISHLFLTHYHTDHMGGAAQMRELLGCE